MQVYGAGSATAGPKVHPPFRIVKRDPCMRAITRRDSEAESAKKSRQKVEVNGIYGAEDI
jgi:hypothetical protein